MKIFLVMGFNYEMTDQYGAFATREAAQRFIDSETVEVEKVLFSKVYRAPKNDANFEIVELEVQE